MAECPDCGLGDIHEGPGRCPNCGHQFDGSEFEPTGASEAPAASVEAAPEAESEPETSEDVAASTDEATPGEHDQGEEKADGEA